MAKFFNEVWLRDMSPRTMQGVVDFLGKLRVGVRPHNLPVIILWTLVDPLHRLPIRGQTEKVEMAVIAGVGGVEHQRRSRGRRQQREAAGHIAQPDHRARVVAACSRRSRRKNQIERAIVIEISDVHAHLARKVGARVRHSCDLGCLPALPFVLV